MKCGAEAVIQTSNSGSIKEKMYEKWIPTVKRVLKSKQTRGWGFDFPLCSYTKNEFNRIIEANGFQVTEWDFYDFHFPFLERISMNLTVRLAKWLQKHSKKASIRFLGSGYLVKIKKNAQ
jgi:hypothetical protein